MLAPCKQLRQLGWRPRLKAHLQQVAAGTLRQVLRQMADDRLGDHAARAARLDVGECGCGAWYAAVGGVAEGGARGQLEAFRPQVRRHPTRPEPDLSLDRKSVV